MAEHDKLYEAFGELLYVVAMADGFIQDEEIEALEKVLENHPWAADIKWSFNYERKKGTSLDDAYKKVMDYCTYSAGTGMKGEFENMVTVLEAVAEASAGIDENEREVIDSVVHALTERFKKDIENMDFQDFN